MNDVNGAVARKLRSAAQALRADMESSNFALHSALLAEVEAIEKRADSIEEQVKPAIEEPKEFGSIVRAKAGSAAVGILWQMAPGHGEHYWEDAHGCVEVWSELTDVEVLRTGVGEVPSESQRAAQDDAYAKGRFDQKAEDLATLCRMRAGAVSSERIRAYEKAIRDIGEPS